MPPKLFELCLTLMQPVIDVLWLLSSLQMHRWCSALWRHQSLQQWSPCFNTYLFVLNTCCQIVLVCISLYSIHTTNTYYNTYHNTCQYKVKVLACIELQYMPILTCSNHWSFSQFIYFTYEVRMFSLLLNERFALWLGLCWLGSKWKVIVGTASSSRIWT